jgi:hypothetical protein
MYLLASSERPLADYPGVSMAVTAVLLLVILLWTRRVINKLYASGKDNAVVLPVIGASLLGLAVLALTWSLTFA